MLVLKKISLVGQNRIIGGSVRSKFGMNQILIISQWTRWQIHSWEYIQRMTESVPKRKLEYRKNRRKKPPWWNDKVVEA